jgi:hypothetical protein
MFDFRPELLLHPNIPKPLHGINPRTILGKNWWDIERNKCYIKYNFHCLACGIPKYKAKYHQWLEAHEVYDYKYIDGILTFIELVPLCHSCHNYIHSGRMQHLVNLGKFDYEKQQDILNYGDNIIEKHKLKKPELPNKCAEWSKWKMIVFGKEYYSKFKDVNEWIEYYDKQI